jgi:aldose 1-epimerase
VRPELLPPSGRQYEIKLGLQRAVVTEVAASIREYEVGDTPVLDGYGADEMCSAARGQPLLPWPNRIEDGRYDFGGTSHQLALSEPANHNAWHGLTRWMNWQAAFHDGPRVVMELAMFPQPGYEFTLRLSVEYLLSREGLRVTTKAQNIGRNDAPFGSGNHPYLTLGTDNIDPCLLRIPATGWLEVNERRVPTGRVIPVEGTELDFREGRVLGGTHLATCFTGLLRDHDGVARMSFETPDQKRRLVFWVDRAHPYLLLFSGDGMENVARRRKGLGVEPMTCPPNAFRSSTDLVVLKPGETHVSSWGIGVSWLS